MAPGPAHAPMSGTVAVDVPNWESLERAIQGHVALPGSPAFEASRRPFNARFQDVDPQAIVSCENPQDVAEALSFVRRHDLEIVARSGGHSLAGHSSTRGVIIDVTLMRSVSVSGGVATVGAGARLGEVYERLQEHGLAIPAGTCPEVGVAGLTLGGGLGILGRTYGVTSDSLVGAEIVLADGRILECDAQHDEDLFWALRGAGAGTFGVVTSLVFRTVPAPNATNVHLAWPFSRAADVVEAWQSWAPDGPDELAASLKVTATGDVDRGPSVDVYGALLGAASDAYGLFEELVTRTGSDPVSSSLEHLSFSETRRFWAKLGEAEHDEGESEVGQDESDGGIAPPPEPMCLFAKSEFFRRSLPSRTVTDLLERFSHGRITGESRELDFMPWGGAYNRVHPEATAFVHREERFQLKHAVTVGADASGSEREAAQRQVARWWSTVHPWGSGRVFQNFADPDLDRWSDAYYGPNVDRLVRVKARYDPANLFRLDQSPASR
jgi:FAD/FMN-containing dehydrogenase